MAVGIEEMLESARAVKGAGFVNVAAGVCELMQAAYLVARIETVTQGKDPGVKEAANAVQRLLQVAAARLLCPLSQSDASEALELASRIEARRELITKQLRERHE